MKRIAVFAAFAAVAVSTPLLHERLTASTAAAHDTIHPIVDPRFGYLLGGVRNRRWINDKETSKSIKGGEAYGVYGLNTQLGSTTGSTTRTNEAPCDETYWVRLARNFNGVLAVSATWNAIPRPPRPQSLTQPVYRDVVESHLRSRGLRNPKVVVTQLWRVDLEGDGREEVLVSATNYAALRGGPMSISPHAKAGEYSVVLLRKIVGLRARTIPIAEEIFSRDKTFSAPMEHRLAGVLDANGDGKMEIVLRSRYYEGDFVSLHEVQSGAVKEVLSSGCGA